jgi:hypothetical protein
MQNYLVSGDPMEPCSTDLIAQRKLLKVGLAVPDGWRVLTGNVRESRSDMRLKRSPSDAD